jgi:imidazoleglycerol-phosphate dehydratase
MSARAAKADRKTTETQIALSVDLDGSGKATLATGVPFLDHMLDQVARHAMLDLDIEAKGDLQIDAHHTVEDVGITLGQAVARAVGDKKGIRRYGHAYVPLDEALSRVVIDARRCSRRSRGLCAWRSSPIRAPRAPFPQPRARSRRSPCRS